MRTPLKINRNNGVWEVSSEYSDVVTTFKTREQAREYVKHIKADQELVAGIKEEKV